MRDAKGLELTLRIRRLMRKHGVEPDVGDIVFVPLTAPTDHPQVLEGIASTPDADLHHSKLRPYCFGWPLRLRSMPPLYHKHDTSAPVGTIEELAYDERGALRIRAIVTHEMARRCNAFSIAASVIDYQLRNADRPDFHALITCATLDEVSLTDIPANPRCLVTHRYRMSPKVEFYELLQQRVSRLQQLTALMQQMQKEIRDAM